MGRLLAIDYGRRRCGIAATDPLRIVANPVDTVPSGRLVEWIRSYLARETVDAIVVGLPRDLRGRPSDSMAWITPGITALRRAFPGMPVVWFDERFTSTLAHRAMIDGGMSRTDRRNPGAADSIAAAIILNDYLQSNQYLSDTKQ